MIMMMWIMIMISSVIIIMFITIKIYHWMHFRQFEQFFLCFRLLAKVGLTSLVV